MAGGVGKLRFLRPPLIKQAAGGSRPFVSAIGQVDTLDRRDLQGGYIHANNLLITTLALFAASSTQRAPVAFNPQPVRQVQVFQPPNLLTSTLSGAAAPKPFVRQQVATLVQTPQPPDVDPPPNLVAQVPNLIASAQSELMPTLRPTDVEPWLPRNVTINLPAVSPIPIGRQQVESAPPTPRVLFWDRGSNTLLLPTPPNGRQQLTSAPVPTAVRIDQPPNLLTTTLAVTVQPIPVGGQRTESSPPLPPQVQGYESLNLLVLANFQLPPGTQRTDSSPPIPREVWNYHLPNASRFATPLPIGTQRTESAPYPPTAVQGYEAPNATLFIPVAAPLPIGQQWTASAPIWTVPIGTSVGWTIPPDLLPPFIAPPVPPVVQQTPAGRKRVDRYIARFKGEDYLFETLEGLESFVEWAREAEKPKPKKYRKPVKIRLTPVFAEEVSQYVEIPTTIYQLPASKALEQVRQLERKLDDEDDAEWLILIA